MKYLLLSFSLFVFSSTACKKDNTPAGGQLPDTSSSGKNFLACNVDGKVHIYSGKRSYTRSYGVSFGDFPDRISIYSDGDEIQDAIRVVVIKPFPVVLDSNYQFNAESEKIFAEYDYNELSPPLEYTTRNGSGWVRFSRLDSVASGTFEFNAYYDMKSSSRQEPDTVRITEGRFDISRK